MNNDTFNNHKIELCFYFYFFENNDVHDGRLTISFSNEIPNDILELLLIFSTSSQDNNCIDIKINSEQQITQEMKEKLISYLDSHLDSNKQLWKFKKIFDRAQVGDYFLILPNKPEINTAEFSLKITEHLINLNSKARGVDSSIFIRQTPEVFFTVAREYEIIPIDMGSRNLIGPGKTDLRICRFCNRTKQTGATFKHKAHAIPAALGNTHVLLANECDDCNHYFGEKIEQNLLRILNLERNSSGVKSRARSPKVALLNGGELLYDEDNNLLIIKVQGITDNNGQVIAPLDIGVVCFRDFYRALSKIAISIIPDDIYSELGFSEQLKSTIEWVRYGKPEQESLPKILKQIRRFPDAEPSEFIIFIRKSENNNLPKVLCQFRVGCFIYIYILPFADGPNNIDIMETEYFREVFKFLFTNENDSFQDYSYNQAVQLRVNLCFNNNPHDQDDKAL